MLDHPPERFQRRRIGIDEAHAPKIDVNGAGDVAGAIVIGRSQIEQQRRRAPLCVEHQGKLARTYHQLRVWVALHN